MLKRSARPLVTIGIPTYNRPDDLMRLMINIKNQSYKNLQIIISDNGGSISNEIIGFLEKDDRFELYVNDENIGLLKNTELVLKKAKGKYFCWCSDDDWRSDFFIEALVEQLEINKTYLFAFSNFHERDYKSQIIAPYRNNLSNRLKYMKSNSKLYRQFMFYLDDQSLGKCNAFYAMFLTSSLKEIDFYKTSEGYSNYAMDNYIVFQMLGKGPALIVDDTHVSLHCMNKKFYQITKTKSFLKKCINNFINDFGDLKLSIKLTSNYILKIMIAAVFPLKVLKCYFMRCASKIIIQYKTQGADWLEYNSLDIKDIKLNLDDITLVCVATKNVERSVLAIRYSCKNIKFKSVKLFSHYNPKNLDNIDFIKIESFNNVEEWGKFIIYELHKYISTKYIILIHDDGYIVNSDSWNDEFYKYDFIGAPWPEPKDKFSFRTDTNEIVRVGNSVSLRSKLILELPSRLSLPWKRFHGFLHEDGFLNVQYRNELIKHGVNFPPLEIAEKFGREVTESNFDPFTFHKWKGKNKNFPNFNSIE